jgi:hypothetical protein
MVNCVYVYSILVLTYESRRKMVDPMMMESYRVAIPAYGEEADALTGSQDTVSREIDALWRRDEFFATRCCDPFRFTAAHVTQAKCGVKALELASGERVQSWTRTKRDTRSLAVGIELMCSLAGRSGSGTMSRG